MSLGFSGSLPEIFYIDFVYLYLLLANKRDEDDDDTNEYLLKKNGFSWFFLLGYSELNEVKNNNS
jgi:hypothetical protein